MIIVKSYKGRSEKRYVKLLTLVYYIYEKMGKRTNRKIGFIKRYNNF